MRIELPSNKIETIGLYVYSSFEGLDFEKDRKLIEAVFKRIEGKFSKKEESVAKNRSYSKNFEYRVYIQYNPITQKLNTSKNCFWFDGNEIIYKELIYHGGFFKSDNSNFFFEEEKVALAMYLESMHEKIINEIVANKDILNKQLLNNVLLID